MASHSSAEGDDPATQPGAPVVQSSQEARESASAATRPYVAQDGSLSPPLADDDRKRRQGEQRSPVRGHPGAAEAAAASAAAGAAASAAAASAAAVQAAWDQTSAEEATTPQGPRARTQRMKARQADMDEHLAKVEEMASWCQQELIYDQQQRAGRSLRFVNYPQELDKTGIEKVTMAWRARHGLQGGA